MKLTPTQRVKANASFIRLTIKETYLDKGYDLLDDDCVTWFGKEFHLLTLEELEELIEIIEGL